MEKIVNKEYGGERPLYCMHDLQLDNVIIHKGESSLKETSNIEANGCTFEGKYVFWECHYFKATNCIFAESARSSLWYSSNGLLIDCKVDAPKMFRRMSNIYVYDCTFTNGLETLWDCDYVRIKNTTIDNCDYLGMHTNHVYIENYVQNGNYSFQYSNDVEIHDALLNSKDAFWESNNVTIYDSEINGEYLGWYSKNLKLIRCHITGTQPLCYCENLVLEDCTFGDDADLAFEYSGIHATIIGDIISIKNPSCGNIQVKGNIGELILDNNQKFPKNCKIISNNYE